MLKIKVSRKQYAAKVVWSLSSNMISDGEFIIPYKLLLTDRQVSNFCWPFENHPSGDVKLS